MVGVAFICCTFVAKIKCHLSIFTIILILLFSEASALQYNNLFNNMIAQLTCPRDAMD